MMMMMMIPMMTHRMYVCKSEYIHDIPTHDMHAYHLHTDLGRSISREISLERDLNAHAMQCNARAWYEEPRYR